MKLGIIAASLLLSSINLFAKDSSVSKSSYSNKEEEKECVIPIGITHLEYDFFQKHNNLRKLVIPNGVLGIHSGLTPFFYIPHEITIYTDNKHLKQFILRSGNKVIIKSISEAPDSMFKCNKQDYIKANNAIKPAISAASVNCPLTGCVDIRNFPGRPIVAEGGFVEQKSITSIILPKTTERICSGAFMYCDKLISINIPQSVQSIDDHAFSYCYSLSIVTLEQGIKKIGHYAFAECKELNSFCIPNSVVYIGQCAFFRSGIKNIKIGNSITHIKSGTFSNCYKLESINIPTKVFSIDGHAFNRCLSLKNVTIDGDIKYIGESAFKDCEALESINIPSSIISIGMKAFHGCSKCIFTERNQRTKDMLLKCGSNIDPSQIVLQ